MIKLSIRRALLMAASAACLSVTSTQLRAQTADSQPAATTAPATQDARWAPIIERLGDNDFAVREAAQKELDKTDWRQLDFLRSAAAAAQDPEIKARLAGRVTAIEEDLAANPPPISLTLKDASPQDVANAFSKILGTPLELWPPGNGFGPGFGGAGRISFTLDTHEKPFWEVFFALARQHPLAFQDMGNRIALTTQGNNWHTPVIAGPLAVIPTDLVRTHRVDLQNPQAQQPETLTLQCTFALDPRLHIVKYSTPVFTQVKDDRGNDLSTPSGGGQVWEGGMAQRAMVQSSATNLRLTEPRGTRIVSAKGTTEVVVQIGEEKLEIANADTKSGQSFQFAGRTFELKTLKADPIQKSVEFSVSISGGAGGAGGGLLNRIGGGAGSAPGISFQILDNANTLIDSNVINGGGIGGSTSGMPFVLPLKIRLATPTKTKTVTIPFELKDLPLP